MGGLCNSACTVCVVAQIGCNVTHYIYRFYVGQCGLDVAQGWILHATIKLEMPQDWAPPTAGIVSSYTVIIVRSIMLKKVDPGKLV